ncbi:hypothetical protein CoNPh4_CDS0115 [Staphylococcus phage S-CoN_Ph4]|nr:hypothetical protein CoNPh4_CDS0115 [Staphylococcus phage S-CoN_Ph4]WNM52434.1 hypothetical protein CoNPh7_CDS0062 [Staphylococcus phage S-CoN_Ph7]WNM53340.1 hypothetical protein CoNPh12_CDS0053 [Staphylococcus phage S-CoN_Ph12]WNM53898.1 hypothetical protein CoNPh15_CDS0052 [Staphylococcus phage S-CoN_Ph15]WNM54145.1 hypothetical protein CoNPh16_CDS0130 [Staphylococcus phage S-CoN_Ph16]
MDYVGHPGKLLQKVMSEFGADFSMVKGKSLLCFGTQCGNV